MDFRETVEAAGKAIDLVGVAAIVGGAGLATLLFAWRLWEKHPPADAYRQYRQGLGRAILLGLEFLVAADIIRTVAVSPSFESVGVLGLIVLIRTVLSFSLEVELEGRWPWDRGRDPGAAGPEGGEG
ncbi:MAG TPA: DUF1622 domain-containing protein [Dehalococcoidia bacterium]